MSPTLPPEVLSEAADWLMRLQSGSANAADHQAWQHWHDSHDDHRLAWQRAEALLQTLGSIPPAIGQPALNRPFSASRRQALRQLALLLAAGPALWAIYKATPWQAMRADYRTAVGEQKTVVLADGSTLILNTDTAVDLHFDQQHRLLHLHQGEILLQTGHRPGFGPLQVATRQGWIHALGTRFVVRQQDSHTDVSVLEGKVMLAPRQSAGLISLEAGQGSQFTSNLVAPHHAVDEGAASWTSGMLVAENMRLAEVVTELNRYRSGVLRCDEAVSNLRISGAFPLTQPDRSLALLTSTFPVKVRQIGPWAVMVAA